MTGVVYQHTTILNQTLWESKLTVEMIGKMRKEFATLESETDRITQNVENIVRNAFHYFQYFRKLSESFGAIEKAFIGLDKMANDLEKGLRQLREGVLTEEIFSHDDMEKAIADINSRMDEGWAISKDDLFNVYGIFKNSMRNFGVTG